MDTLNSIAVPSTEQLVGGKRVVKLDIEGNIKYFLQDGSTLIPYDPSEQNVSVNWKDEKTGEYKFREIDKRVTRIGNGRLFGVHKYVDSDGNKKVALVKWIKYKKNGHKDERWGHKNRIDFNIADGKLFDTALNSLRELDVIK